MAKRLPSMASSSVSMGYFFKHVLLNQWPSNKLLPAKSTTYHNFSILEKDDVDHALYDELTAVPTFDQEIMVVDSQTVYEQNGDIRVSEVDQQMLSEFLDRNRRAQASDTLPSAVCHYSAKQLFRMLLPLTVSWSSSSLSIPKLWPCKG